MTTVLDLYIDWYYINWDMGTRYFVQIDYRPGIEPFFSGDQLIYSVSGVGVDAVNPDVVNEIYATIEDAIDAYQALALYQFKSQLTVYSPDTFVFGQYIYVEPIVNDNINSALALANIQPNWTQTNTTLSDYIKNKPSIPAAQVQSDWTSSSGVSAILNKPSIPSTARTTSAISPSLVGSGATGTQVSGTKDSSIRLNVSTSTTSSIGGPSTSLVALKICSTNNATEANWTTVATLENDQTITLAIVLNSIQVMKGQLVSDVPAGWYYKLVNSGTGTHSESAITGQQTIYG